MNYEDRDLFRSHLPDNFSVQTLSLRPRLVRLLVQQALLPALAQRADVVHSPSFIMPYVRAGARHVLMVHDMTSFSLPHCHTALRRSAIYRRMVLTSLRRADVVTVPSRATQQAILEILPALDPGRIHVTVPGIGEEFRPYAAAEVHEVLTRLRIPQPYILFVGTIEPRKNLTALLKSYGRLAAAGNTKEHLVLAGRLGWAYQEILQEARSPVLREKVHFIGYVNQDDLPLVYAGARLFVFPSLEEGFGFPPLEAMACGVPVISSLSSSLAENLEGAATLVPPDDVSALTQWMRTLLNDKSLAAKRREQGIERAAKFRWQETARRTLDAYRAAVEAAGA
jgi:glycosyltransferase involved in cell wall biosynthesis